ncbi:MAG TPA: hypothetical protein VGZ27_03370 [Vicinamibacterales bacterium]|nr:hypothetical protein [Vicinamibacterales bacterium]
MPAFEPADIDSAVRDEGDAMGGGGSSLATSARCDCWTMRPWAATVPEPGSGRPIDAVAGGRGGAVDRDGVARRGAGALAGGAGVRDIVAGGTGLGVVARGVATTDGGVTGCVDREREGAGTGVTGCVDRDGAGGAGAGGGVTGCADREGGLGGLPGRAGGVAVCGGVPGTSSGGPIARGVGEIGWT